MGKRAFDIVASAAGLLVLLPLFVIVALLVKATSRGPVFFRQVRVGRDGREFRVWKFRTMVADAPGLGASLTVAGDNRITRAGTVLRAWKIDELPQLVNVLVGEMSLVGPRPEVPRYVALYDERQRRVLDARPGITDYASITYFEENAILARAADPENTYVREVMPHKLEMNLRYLERQGFWEDIRIILATLYLAFQKAIGGIGRPVQVLSDAAVVAVAFWLAYQIRFEFDVPPRFWKQMVLLLPYTVLARVVANFAFGVYRVMWRYVSLYEIPRFARSVAAVSLIFLVFRFLVEGPNPYYRIPISIILLEGLLSFLAMTGLRFLRRWIHETTAARPATEARAPEKVVVIGAGDSGRAVVHEIRLRPELGMVAIGIVDDDTQKIGSEIEGRKVLGTLDDLRALHRKWRFSQALISIAELAMDRKRLVMDACAELGVQVRVLPAQTDIISGRARVEPVRAFAIEDLLGRAVRDLARNDPMLEPVYGGKRILISGAGGSIGSELCRQVARLEPERLILVERDENNLFQIKAELAWRFPGLSVEGRMVDVRDRERLARVFREVRPGVVLHAAACKHVPLVEENPGEAIETNVLGTRNLVGLSESDGVENFVMLSTDKAVNPTSIMGATKRIAELIVRMHGERSRGTRFASVRFGNVLGSRGSVIPTFREQIARGGPVTVTHPEVTRYFMTIPEASQLVLKAGTIGKDGDVFLLDMGAPIRIRDLARDMIRLSGFREGEIPIEFTGLRPGEKLFEELLLDRDRALPTTVEKVFMSRPELRDFEAFQIQVDTLLGLAPTGDRRELRATLGGMDIGLREPDGPGPNKGGNEEMHHGSA
jgi:FlaA1/EpsC-like NDP-sugar epimerase/lipopolysaccharide/colanic/teichoic acid biosynthesis glycosyltransferase